MASFVGRLQNILTSKLFAVVLISLLLSCLSIFPIANASAQPCDWNWDILSISGIKTNYQPGETISGNISFRLHNKANSGAIQQLLIGIIDLQNKVIDVKCVYNGAPKDCPEWTTGTASFSLKAPVTPGNYKVIAADDLENSCSDAINRFPSLCSSTSPYCKDITTITISAGRTEIAPPIPTSSTSPPPTLPSQPDTGKKNGTVGAPDTTKPSGGIASIALNKNTIIIISFVAALVILTLFASRKKGSKHFTKSILLLVLISFICYLFWVYAIPPIADWFRHNLSTIIGVLLSLGALAIAGIVIWKNWNKIPSLNPEPPGSKHDNDIDIDQLCSKIKMRIYKINIPRRGPTELYYQGQLHQWLLSEFPNTEWEKQEEGHRPDLVVNDIIAIEVKGPTTNDSLKDLITKTGYLKKHKRLICVLFEHDYDESEYQDITRFLKNKFGKRIDFIQKNSIRR